MSTAASAEAAAAGRRPPRILIIPGLHDSGPAHWQTWLQGQYRDARRVTQRDPSRPELERWAERITRTLEVAGDGEWLAVAHSFGCLALARHLADQPGSPIREALLVAPAEPDKFGLAHALPQHRLPRRARLIASSTDPWMSAASAARWAHRWGASYSNLGNAGHINAEAGFGPLPAARSWVEAARARAAAEHRPRAAAFSAWACTI
ncbi:MAG: alpha/beta hydrolase [Roseateles sp.]|uniref:RBBP9/YdeN family alpha/beta hydrolase n=1 Tax=Roseateles sp. TaxID=1971397 RepID=UPI0039E75EB4